MKVKYIYVYANGLQWDLFDENAVLIMGKLYQSHGHFHIEPETITEKSDESFPVGILCDLSIADQQEKGLQIARRSNKIRGVSDCPECVRRFKEIKNPETTNWNVWVR